MFKSLLAAAFAAALIAAPATPSFAQATTTQKSEKAAKKTAKPLTAQQQKMKDCGAKWQDHKKEKNVKGQAEYRKFLKTCLSA